MKIFGLLILFLGFLSCGNQTYRTQESINYEKLPKNSRKTEQITYNNEGFKGIVLNSQLAEKFDSIQKEYLEYDKRKSGFDTLMLFRKDDRDTLIRIEEVKFIKSFDPNAAYYLYENDTIIGGNGFCSSNYYLFQNEKLSKIINQYADCIESSSSRFKVLIFESEMKKWFYLKDINDVIDMSEFKKGFEGSKTEIFVYFHSNKVQYAIRKKYINCRSDMDLIDTIKYELIQYNDFSYFIPEIID